MKNLLVYVLGVISGIILTFVLPIDNSKDSNTRGLEMYESPGEYMDFIRFEITQVRSDGSALAEAFYGGVEVLLLPDENQHFYDKQVIELGQGKRALQVGIYKHGTNTCPVVRIVDGVESSKRNGVVEDSALVLFDEPGECVTRKNLEVQKVLESGNAIAKEINQIISGYIFTSDLEVLLLTGDGRTFYDKQIVKIPNGKCARQIGTYKYHAYDKILPVVEIR